MCVYVCVWGGGRERERENGKGISFGNEATSFHFSPALNFQRFLISLEREHARTRGLGARRRYLVFYVSTHCGFEGSHQPKKKQKTRTHTQIVAFASVRTFFPSFTPNTIVRSSFEGLAHADRYILPRPFDFSISRQRRWGGRLVNACAFYSFFRNRFKIENQRHQKKKKPPFLLKAFWWRGEGIAIWRRIRECPLGSDLFIKLTCSSSQGAWAWAWGRRDGGDRVEPVGVLVRALRLALVISPSGHHPSHPTFIALACYSRVPTPNSQLPPPISRLPVHGPFRLVYFLSTQANRSHLRTRPASRSGTLNLAVRLTSMLECR